MTRILRFALLAALMAFAALGFSGAVSAQTGGIHTWDAALKGKPIKGDAPWGTGMLQTITGYYTDPSVYVDVEVDDLELPDGTILTVELDYGTDSQRPPQVVASMTVLNQTASVNTSSTPTIIPTGHGLHSMVIKTSSGKVVLQGRLRMRK